MELTLIAPFRNARQDAAQRLEQLHQYLEGLGVSFELLAVDDGSEDGTCGVLGRSARQLAGVRVLRADRRLGKGACLGEAFRTATGERVVFTDGDLAFPLDKIDELRRALDSADVAVASRDRAFSWTSFFDPRAWLSLVFTAVVKRALLPDVQDSQAGLKAFRRSAAQLVASRQRCPGFAFDVEALAVARRFGLKVQQVKTTWRAGGPSTVRPVIDGLAMLRDLAGIWLRLRAGAYERLQRQPWVGRLRELDLSDDAALSRAEKAMPRWEERAADFIVANPTWLLVPLSSLLIAVWFLPEILHCSLFMNDGVLHASILRRMEEAWANGGDIFDFWLKNVSGGHAFIRVSHFLLYLTAFLLHKTLFGAGTPEFALALTIFLTAVLTPWSIYKGGRLLGFTIAQCAVAAALLPIVRDSGGFGLSLENFTFSGHGLYNEGFAMLSFPITLGLAHRALKKQGGLIPAAICYTITWMSHLFVGYMAALWIGLDALLIAAGDRKRWAEPLGRMLGLNALFGLFGAGLIVPVMQDRLLQLRSLDEPYYRFMGRGAEHVLSRFFLGRMFDNGKLYPAITALAIAGLVAGLSAALWRKKKPAEDPLVLVCVQGAVWVLIAFGRATWGTALSILPFAKDVHWHRMIGCAQLMMLYAAGVALCAACGWLWRRSAAASVALAAVVFCPGLIVGGDYFLGTNLHNLVVTERAWIHDTELHSVVAFANAHQDFRMAPGDYRNFGKEINLLPGFPLFAVLNEFDQDVISMLYHSLSLTSPLNYGVDPMNRADMQLVNVRWVVLPSRMRAPDGWKPMLRGPKATVYDNGETEGYFMVGSAAPARCADNDILYYSIRKWLAGPDQDNGIFPGVRLQDECEGTETLIDAADTKAKPTVSGRVLSAGTRRFRGGLAYWADVRMDSPGLIVFKMEYHPSWRITLNGLPAKTYMVMPGYTGVRVSAPGAYVIEARYESSGLRKWLLLLGALCALVLGWWSRGSGSSDGDPQPAPAAPAEWLAGRP